MEVLNIQKYLKNFNIVISDDVYTNIDLREDMDYYPQVSEYIQKHWRKYKDSYFIDNNTDNNFYTMLYKSLGIEKCHALIKTEKQLKYLKNSLIMNDILKVDNLWCKDATKYNAMLKGKSIAFLICLSLRDLKFCKRLFSTGLISHIIILKPVPADYDFISYINTKSYKLYEMTPKGNVEKALKNLKYYDPILISSSSSKINNSIIVNFD